MVSIIIVNYNTKDLLKNCIESIIHWSTDSDYEIIVVDNASSDGSNELINQFYPNVNYKYSDVNLGFGKANNIGAKMAKGEFLFFLNSDTLILNNVIAKYLNFTNSNSIKNIGVIGSILEDEEGNEIHSYGKFPSKYSILKNIIIGYAGIRKKTRLYRNDEQEVFEVDYVTGANNFISKNLFVKIGGFDEAIFLYYEDTDLQLRLQNIGYHNFIIPGPKISHLEGASNKLNSFDLKRRLIVTKSMFYFFKKHSGFLSYYLFRLLYLILRAPIIFDTRISFTSRLNYLQYLAFSREK